MTKTAIHAQSAHEWGTRQDKQKQIPSLRYGMTTKRGKGQYRDSGRARMTDRNKQQKGLTVAAGVRMG